MYKKAIPFFLICETPLHAGSGSDLGVIDLPIQRERHTTFPKIESSSLKGSLREAFEVNPELQDDAGKEKIHLAFGYDDQEINDNVKEFFDGANKQFQGAFGFTDARLLLFPVKSMKGVFVWVTCPKVLEQFRRDMSLDGIELPDDDLKKLLNDVVPEVKSEECHVSNDKVIVNPQETKKFSQKIILEEYAFTAILDTDYCGKLALGLAKWLFPCVAEGDVDLYAFWRRQLTNNLVILPNEDFTDFVNLSTEVLTRIKIDNEKGTVQDGALFTEEYLPAESVLYSLALVGPIFHNNDKKVPFVGDTVKGEQDQSEFETGLVADFFKSSLPTVVQIGGNATLGKGLVRTVKLN